MPAEARRGVPRSIATLLHELYFASLGGDGPRGAEMMAEAITRDFGSIDRWRKEFIALASGAGRRCRAGSC